MADVDPTVRPQTVGSSPKKISRRRTCELFGLLQRVKQALRSGIIKNYERMSADFDGWNIDVLQNYLERKIQ